MHELWSILLCVVDTLQVLDVYFQNTAWKSAQLYRKVSKY